MVNGMAQSHPEWLTAIVVIGFLILATFVAMGGDGFTGRVAGAGAEGGIAMRINPGEVRNAPGLYRGAWHHDTLIGSYLDGSASHGFISTGYSRDDRKFSIGTASSGNLDDATFVSVVTIIGGQIAILSESPAAALDVAGTVRGDAIVSDGDVCTSTACVNDLVARVTELERQVKALEVAASQR